MLGGSSKVTPTQKGSIGESIVKIGLILESDGRLSPFEPFADDDGIDLLVYDKTTGIAVPLQVKTRTQDPQQSPNVQFRVRRATFHPNVPGFVLAVLLDQDGKSVLRTWLIPMADLCEIAVTDSRKRDYVVRPSMKGDSKDKYTTYRCSGMAEVTRHLCEHFDHYAVSA